MSNTVISLKGIKREFNLGDEIIQALKEINLDINKNEINGIDTAQYFKIFSIQF